MALSEQEELELLELERQRALSTTKPAPPTLKEIGIEKLSQMGKTGPASFLPPLPTSLKQVPGAELLSKGPQIIAENPEGAAKALPAITATAATVLAGPAALPLIPSALGVGGAAAGGSYLRDKYLGKTAKETGMNALKEGATAALLEGAPAAITAAKPFIKAHGFDAIDNLMQAPQGTAATAYGNTRTLAKGLGDKYLPQIKTAAESLSKLVKSASDKVKAEYGAAVEKVMKAKGGRPSVSAPILKGHLDELADGVGIGKSGVQPGSDAVRTEVKTLLDDFANDVSRPVKKTVTEKGKLGETITREVEELEVRGNVALDKALNLRKKLGEMADFVDTLPGQGKQAAALRKAYGDVTNFIHKQHPEIAKVDSGYKKLIDASSYLRQKLGIKPGEEASLISVEKMEQFIRTINNPAKKETMQEAVDTMSKELGRKRSVVKKAAEINASKEFGNAVNRRKSVNLFGVSGRVLDSAMRPLVSPPVLGSIIKATKKISTAAGKVGGKRQAVTAAGLAARYGSQD